MLWFLLTSWSLASYPDPLALQSTYLPPKSAGNFKAGVQFAEQGAWSEAGDAWARSLQKSLRKKRARSSLNQHLASILDAKRAHCTSVAQAHEALVCWLNAGDFAALADREGVGDASDRLSVVRQAFAMHQALARKGETFPEQVARYGYTSRFGARMKHLVDAASLVAAEREGLEVFVNWEAKLVQQDRMKDAYWVTRDALAFFHGLPNPDHHTLRLRTSVAGRVRTAAERYAEHTHKLCLGLFEKGHYADVVQLGEEALAVRPAHAGLREVVSGAYMSLGAIDLDRRNYEASYAHYASAYDTNGDPRASQWASSIAFGFGEFALAEGYCQAASLWFARAGHSGTLAQRALACQQVDVQVRVDGMRNLVQADNTRLLLEDVIRGLSSERVKVGSGAARVHELWWTGRYIVSGEEPFKRTRAVSGDRVVPCPDDATSSTCEERVDLACTLYEYEPKVTLEVDARLPLLRGRLAWSVDERSFRTVSEDDQTVASCTVVAGDGRQVEVRIGDRAEPGSLQADELAERPMVEVWDRSLIEAYENEYRVDWRDLEHRAIEPMLASVGVWAVEVLSEEPTLPRPSLLRIQRP